MLEFWLFISEFQFFTKKLMFCAKILKFCPNSLTFYLRILIFFLLLLFWCFDQKFLTYHLKILTCNLRGFTFFLSQNYCLYGTKIFSTKPSSFVVFVCFIFFYWQKCALGILFLFWSWISHTLLPVCCPLLTSDLTPLCVQQEAAGVCPQCSREKMKETKSPTSPQKPDPTTVSSRWQEHSTWKFRCCSSALENYSLSSQWSWSLLTSNRVNNKSYLMY